MEGKNEKSHGGQTVALVDTITAGCCASDEHHITNDWTLEDAHRLNADISDMLACRLARYIALEDRNILTLAVAVVKNANWHEVNVEGQYDE